MSVSIFEGEEFWIFRGQRSFQGEFDVPSSAQF